MNLHDHRRLCNGFEAALVCLMSLDPQTACSRAEMRFFLGPGPLGADYTSAVLFWSGNSRENDRVGFFQNSIHRIASNDTCLLTVTLVPKGTLEKVESRPIVEKFTSTVLTRWPCLP